MMTGISSDEADNVIVGEVAALERIPTSTVSEPEVTSEPTEIPEVKEEPTPEVDNEEEFKPYIELTPEEQQDLVSLVYLEAGCEPYECKKGVASVVINRMTQYDQTLHEVIYAPNQFTPAKKVKNHIYTDEEIAAVMEVITYGPSLPENVLYFRADYYHKWAPKYGIHPYCQIGDTYFSYDENYSA